MYITEKCVWQDFPWTFGSVIHASLEQACKVRYNKATEDIRKTAESTAISEHMGNMRAFADILNNPGLACRHTRTAEQGRMICTTASTRMHERSMHMEKIASFTVNHLKLLPGIYVSRKDHVGSETITTFDLRMTAPNREPVMNTAECHTIEHLGATFLRNDPEYKDRVIYFGPMGCRTGFYLILAGDYKSRDIVPLVKRTFAWISDYEGDIPGAAARDCGNYLDQNLSMARWLAKRYLERDLAGIDDSRLIYPE